MAFLEVCVGNNSFWLASFWRAVRKSNQKLLFKSRRSPRHIQKLVTSVMRAGEGCHRKGEKRRYRLNRQAVFLSFTNIVNYERSSLEC